MNKTTIISGLDYRIERYADKIVSLYMEGNSEKKLQHFMSVQKALMEFKEVLEDAE